MPDKKQPAQPGGLPMPIDKSIDNREIRPAGSSNPAPTATSPTVSQGLMSSTTSSSSTSQVPEFTQTPQMNWKPQEFKDHGYSAAQTRTDYSYDPRKESMVRHQMTGLLDTNSDLMRRAIANSQSFSASRGLQSSSIAAGAGQAAMIDRALPIAQQDAQTHSQADQLGWQHNFQGSQNQLDRDQQRFLQENNQAWQSGENQLTRDQQRILQELSQTWQSGENSANRNWQSGENTLNRDQQTMLQQMSQAWQSGENQLTRQQQQLLQELSQSWQSGENTLGRDFQRELQHLQHQQNLGMLDAQGQQRLKEMEFQQNWQSGENTLGRDFQRELQHLQHQQNLGMLDAQGQQRLKEMEFQQSWQSGENSANRQFQEQMQHLQHQQSLGLLDAQGQQQLQQMERNSQLTQERDRLLQQFQSANMDKQYLQQLELASVQFEQSMNELSVRLSADQDMQMRNSMTQLQNNYLAQVGMIMSNPNFTTSDQIQNALEALQDTFSAQQAQLKTIWGFVGEGGGEQIGGDIGGDNGDDGGGGEADDNPTVRNPMPVVDLPEQPDHRDEIIDPWRPPRMIQGMTGGGLMSYAGQQPMQAGNAPSRGGSLTLNPSDPIDRIPNPGLPQPILR